MSDLRMPDLNIVVVAGRLTRDPELKYTGAGLAYCKVSIANSRKFRDKDGSQREETLFLEGTLWDKQAEWVADKLAKGRPVLAEGRLRQSEWEDRETGQKCSRIELSITRLQALDWDGESRGQSAPRQATQGARPAQAATKPQHVEVEPVPDDDIPF